MEIEKIKELMAHFEASKLCKFVYKKGDLEVVFEKETTPSFHPPKALDVHHTVKAETREEASGTFVTSPMVGTFYGLPAPDEAPFVRVGDKVSENTIVCIIEAMKVMNEVKAGVSGVVAEILVENAQPVEFGTRLLRIS